jgi:hypothetical protein
MGGAAVLGELPGGFVACRSCGLHGQLQLDPGPDEHGPPAHAQGPSIQHAPTPQHQQVAAARGRVELQEQLDQACAAAGGEGRHDPPGHAGQDLQALTAQRPPEPRDVGATALGMQVGRSPLRVRWIQDHGQDGAAGWLVEADDPDRWELIKADGPEAVPPTGRGPEPERARCDGDDAGARVDGPGASWEWMGSVG